MIFKFIDNIGLQINTNNLELIEEIKLYYVNYIYNFPSNNILNIHVEESNIIVSANFYSQNPKVYNCDNPFKLITDIIDDFISLNVENKINNENLLLHASCLIYNDIPLIFMGKTLSGKSTVILKLLHFLQNAEFVSDDIVIFNMNQDNKIFLCNYSMPLHIRTYSLVYNELFETRKLDNETYWVPYNNKHLKINNKSDIEPRILLNIKYDNHNSCCEMEGFDKVKILLDNIKYYNKHTLKNMFKYLSKIKIYNIVYRDDDYLIDLLSKLFGIKIMLNQTLPLLRKYIKSKLIHSKVVIQGNSMNPTLKHGQSVSINDTPYNQIQSGDVIIYNKYGHYTAHRVIDVVTINNSKYLQTKGDANTEKDMYLVGENEYCGQVLL